MSDKKSSSGEKLLYCSFCGKSQHEVKKFIAGPSTFICDECIDLCNDIITDEELLLVARLEIERGTVKGIVDARAVAGHVGITKKVKGRRGGDIHRRRASEELIVQRRAFP